MNSQEKTTERESGQGKSVLSITLPKGGSDILGFGKKFAANPVTGTFSMTMTVDTSPGRSGFVPIPASGRRDSDFSLILPEESNSYLLNEIERAAMPPTSQQKWQCILFSQH